MYFESPASARKDFTLASAFEGACAGDGGADVAGDGANEAASDDFANPGGGLTPKPGGDFRTSAAVFPNPGGGFIADDELPRAPKASLPVLLPIPPQSPLLPIPNPEPPKLLLAPCSLPRPLDRSSRLDKASPPSVPDNAGYKIVQQIDKNNQNWKKAIKQ